MRYLTVRLVPTESGGFHPLGQQLSAESAVRREAIHHVELLDDGTVLTLAEGSGDRERYETIMAASPSVHRYMLSGEERWMAVSQFEPTEPVRRILAWQRRADVVVETPIRFGDGGSQTVTFLGDDSAFRAIFDAAETAAFDLEVVQTGEYDPDARWFTRSLTNRQADVLAAAVDVGYYRAPREATQEDVAEAVGLAPSTVGTHLRKIEAKVFEALAR
ncbi:helix-turn-helix domain-containing protein [Haloarcula onubensis]|uniref:Helix-turn-helix domain-containing protein n=1 Tax=Haloarcula onubensis TaxID=2950539 RepID=A0ABU2FQQ5_9EURY|nr:helix-turn-helix domain-containing protein [Halomicroarcula sp. S3CR25-11]MDS0282632.1 helix-turn-helix domain-containing protein [Halomicroarcula sp. S3CR25-11]